MVVERPFRFGVQVSQTGSGEDWTAKAGRVEALSYSALVMPDHVAGCLAFGPALAAAAAVTRRLRLGTLVLANDLRQPALVAKEAATLDLLSGGRLELGLGAGWMRDDYSQTGIPFDPPGVRVSRLEESIQIIEALFADGPVTFQGRHYAVTDLEGYPKPVQRPHPPFVMGGGGKRMLGIAAREAATVDLVPKSLPDGSGLDIADATAAAMERKVGWVRDAAGERFAELELSVLLQRLVITGDAARATEELSREWEPMTPEEVVECPYALIGTVDQIVETLRARRTRWGISRVVVFERDMTAFAPIVARLAGE